MFYDLEKLGMSPMPSFFPNYGEIETKALKRWISQRSVCFVLPYQMQCLVLLSSLPAFCLTVGFFHSPNGLQAPEGVQLLGDGAERLRATNPLQV